MTGSTSERSAIVLAGGRGIRLGPEMPKALRCLGGIPLLERALRLARDFSDDVWVSAPNSLALPSVDAREARVVRDPPAFGPWPGPLVAMSWALGVVERPWALVLAVDLPLARPALLELLWQRRNDRPTPAPSAPAEGPALGVVPWRAHGPEPLLALYRREAGSALLAVATGGERSAMRAVPGLPLVRLDETAWRAADPQALSFENANSPEDWARLERHLAAGEPRS